MNFADDGDMTFVNAICLLHYIMVMSAAFKCCRQFYTIADARNAFL